MLLKNGCYQSFGKPHDGLGFVPDLMEHLNGSTAIGGIAIYTDTVFPRIYRGSTFGGNVMTSRINRNSLKPVGGGYQAQEELDFLISGDSWFRPVDLQVGPDGALYVADFYNRIIGHYEVPLDHPGRDRERGRIWKIVYTGDENRRDDVPTPPRATVDLTQLTIQQLFEEFQAESIPHRLLVADRLADHFGDEVIDEARSRLCSNSATMRTHSLCLLHQLGALQANELSNATQDSDPVVRTHAFRLIGDRASLEGENVVEILARGFKDPDPIVRRNAVLSSSEFLLPELSKSLFELYHKTPTHDVYLRHATKMALRDQLVNETAFKELLVDLPLDSAVFVADICMALKTQIAGEFVAKNLRLLSDRSPGQVKEFVQFASRYISASDIEKTVALIKRQFSDNQPLQLDLLESMRVGFQNRGVEIPEPARAWAIDFARPRLHFESGEMPLEWKYVPHPTLPEEENSWLASVRRNSDDGEKQSVLFSSFVRGEKRTGIYRSQIIVLRKNFRFFMAGHDGFPDKPAQQKNFVRVRDAETHETLRQWGPPRNDTARKFRWITEEDAGKRAYVELVDGDNDTAYAWLAVGRFNDSRLNPSTVISDRQKAATLIANFRLHELKEAVGSLISNPLMDPGTRSSFALALERINPDSRLGAVCEVLELQNLTTEQRDHLIGQLVQPDFDRLEEQMAVALKSATSISQTRVSEKLAASAAGADLLLNLVESGAIDRRILKQSKLYLLLDAHHSQDLSEKISTLTVGLAPEDSMVSDLIQQRKTELNSLAGNRIQGAVIFKKTCAACHQIAGQGQQVGPNLDGIGNRGVDRLLEDVLAPNRNVDRAFQSTIILTDSGQVVSGFAKPSEGSQLVIVNSEGKEISIPKDEIEERKPSLLSPMPANISQQLTKEQLADLIAYLLSLRAG